MPHDRPLVSVVIPAYNAADSIGLAIESVLHQDYDNLEIIVVDDGSDDGTTEVARSFDDPRVRLSRLEENRGECAAMNHGIAMASGDYIAFLDADDQWRANKLTVQMRKLLSTGDYAFVTCNGTNVIPGGEEMPVRCEAVDSNGFDEGECEDMIVRSTDRVVEGRHAWKTLLYRSFIWKPAVVARKSYLDRVGGFDESLKVAGDQDMWIGLAVLGEVGFVPEDLVLIYKNPGTLMSRYPLAAYQNLLPAVRRHVDANRAKLTATEVRTILGKRYREAGVGLYKNGLAWLGLACVLRSLLYGYDMASGWKVLASCSLRAVLSALVSRRQG